jgi:hypothetical protein
MGAYNTIRSDRTCPTCQAPVEWQSKRLEHDRLIIANAMQEIELKPQMDGEMHAFCAACQTWTDATIKKGEVTELKSSKLSSPSTATSPSTT